MKTIKFVKETGCFMTMENENMIDCFFINQHSLENLSSELIGKLMKRLSMDKVVPLAIYNNLFSDKVYLVCKNRDFINENYSFTFSYSQDGKEKGLGHGWAEKYINNEYHLLHDFNESKGFTKVV